MTTTNKKRQGWLRRKVRVRKSVFGTGERPRLSVYKSAKHIYAQLIDDNAKQTLAHASTQDKELKLKGNATLEVAKNVGVMLAKRAKHKGVSKVVFDRHGFLYHGQVKALADGAREGGLEF